MATAYKPQEIVVGPVRVAFPHLDELYAAPTKPGEKPQKPKFSMTALFSPEVQASEAYKALQAEVITVAKANAGETAVQMFKDGDLKHPLRKGNSKAEKYAGFAGNRFATLKSDYRPGIVDRKAQPIPTEKVKDAVYGGSWVYVAIQPYWFDNMGNKGVALGLGNVQKVRDDEQFGGRQAATSQFKPLEEESTGGDGDDFDPLS